MNPCIKTGADVFLTSHGSFYHGDLYHMEGVYVFRYRGDQPHLSKLPTGMRMHARLEDAAAEDASNTWAYEALPLLIDLDGPFRTMIIHQDFVEDFL